MKQTDRYIKRTSLNDGVRLFYYGFNMISYDEAIKKSLEYFNGDDLAAKVVVDKYLLRDAENNLIESTPIDKHMRIASELARIEKGKFKKPLNVDDIFSYLNKYKYIIPQGSPMAGIGDRYRLVSLSNCYVVDSPVDSYGGILTLDEYIVQISKRRGGIGYDISSLRPEGMIVNNCARTTSGAISFMHRFSNSGREVGQNNRRGAQMITISVHHPDIEKFIDIKRNLNSVTGANISIRLTDEFLDAVSNRKKYEQRWPVDSHNPKISRKVSAEDVWNKIIHAARDMAEPGLLFWDNIINESPADCYSEFGYRTVSTNPCSELPLSANDSCRLLVLNLLSYVIDPFTSNARFDYKKLYEHAIIAQRLMDDIVDLELECIDQIIDKIYLDPEPAEIKSKELNLWQSIRNTCYNGRRTGTGITALGDTLAALGIKYGSELSIQTSGKIYQTVKFGCYRSSIDMAKELGPFTHYNHKLEKNCPFLNRFKDETIYFDDTGKFGDLLNCVSGIDIWNDMKKYGRRNISLLTIAPTGSVSILTQTTSGIEPVFMTEYTRRKKITHDDKTSRTDYIDDIGDKWQEFTVYHHGVKRWMDITGETDITKSPYHGCCAEELNWENRVKLQAEVQKHCDHAISSTLNLPETVTVEEVKKIYETAWDNGLKGVTVYRKNCRSGVLVEKEKPKDRPDELICDVHHINVKSDPYFVFIGLKNDTPYEVFAGKNNYIIKPDVIKGRIIKTKRPKGYKAVLSDDTIIQPITMACTDNEEALTRMISMALRCGQNLENISDQLLKTAGEMNSFAKAIARSLKTYIKNGTVSEEKCDTCNSKLVFNDGCKKCMSCGWSKCS